MSTRDVAELPPAPDSASGFQYSSSQTVNFAEDSRSYVAAAPRHGNSGYNYNQVNLIQIPITAGQSYLDCLSTHLLMDVTLTAGTGVTKGLSLTDIGVMGLFRSMTLRVQGGAEVIRMDYINIIMAWLALFYTPEWIHSTGRRYGYGTKMQRVGDAQRTRRMELDMSVFALFSQAHHLPLSAVGLELTFELDNPVNALHVDVAGTSLPTYQLDNVVLYQETISGSEMIDSIVVGALANNEPVMLPMHLYKYQPVVLAANEVNVSKSIPFYGGQVTGVSCYYQKQVSYAAITDDVFGLSVNPGLDNLQIQVGSEYIPPQRINVLSQAGGRGAAEQLALIENFAYRQTSALSARYQGDHFISSPPVAGAAVKDSRFFWSIPMGSGRDAVRGGGLNTANPPVNTVIMHNLSAAVTDALSMNVIFSLKGTFQVDLTGARLIT